MAITMDGIFVNGQKALFRPEDIIDGDVSAYAEAVGSAVETWMEENVTGGEQVTDTTLTLPGVPADAKKTGDQISAVKEDLNAEYVGKRRSLTANDDVFALPVGVYFIVASSESKPSNLPSEFVSTHNGCLVVLEGDSSTARTAFVMDAYSRRIWFRSAYEWVEIVKTDTANALIADAVNGVYTSLNNNLFPDFTNIAQDFYAPSSEVSTTKTQFKFLGSSGVVDVATTYTDWYVTDEIDVTQFTFYFITASARYAGHYLYAFYDANGNILSYEDATGSTAVSINKKLVYAPPNASKLRIATITGASGASLYSAQEKSAGKKWAGLKWACMGDSLTAVNIRTTKHYHDYIAGKTGITVVNLGAGGTGYKQSYAGVSGFMDRVDTIPLDADVVTIFGSGNDHSYTVGDPEDTGTDTLCGCINTTISRIFERITTCQLGIVTPTPWQAYNPADDTNWMARYSAAIVQICKNWGIPCLDLYHCSNLRPWDADFRAAAYSKDDGGGTHPDETGHALIAPRFEAFLDELLMH